MRRVYIHQHISSLKIETKSLPSDWQRYLHNSTLPLEERLQGAKAAFLSQSGQLSTHQKEDVVIQWLTSLIRGKLVSDIKCFLHLYIDCVLF